MIIYTTPEPERCQILLNFSVPAKIFFDVVIFLYDLSIFSMQVLLKNKSYNKNNFVVMIVNVMRVNAAKAPSLFFVPKKVL